MRYTSIFTSTMLGIVLTIIYLGKRSCMSKRSNRVFTSGYLSYHMGSWSYLYILAAILKQRHCFKINFWFLRVVSSDSMSDCCRKYKPIRGFPCFRLNKPQESNCLYRWVEIIGNIDIVQLWGLQRKICSHIKRRQIMFGNLSLNISDTWAPFY